jgi:hypothetical protein
MRLPVTLLLQKLEQLSLTFGARWYPASSFEATPLVQLAGGSFSLHGHTAPLISNAAKEHWMLDDVGAHAEGADMEVDNYLSPKTRDEHAARIHHSRSTRALGALGDASEAIVHPGRSRASAALTAHAPLFHVSIPDEPMTVGKFSAPAITSTITYFFMASLTCSVASLVALLEAETAA